MLINVRHGVLLSYAGEVVKILVNLVYTPIMLHLLGQSEYGLYQLFIQWFLTSACLV